MKKGKLRGGGALLKHIESGSKGIELESTNSEYRHNSGVEKSLQAQGRNGGKSFLRDFACVGGKR